MKKIKILLALFTVVIFSPSLFADNGKQPVLKTKVDSLNYFVGLTTGGSLKEYYLENDSTGEKLKSIMKGVEVGMKKYSEFEALGKNIGTFFKKNEENGLMNIEEIKPNFDIIKQGIINGLRGFEKTMLESDAKAYLETTNGEFHAKKVAKEELANLKNKSVGEEFLVENAKNEDVVQTESGLQYKIITKGTGKKPIPGNTVKVHYHGTLIDGTVFDSSVDRGEPAVFGVTQVIQGWVEALQLMPVGSKWIIYVPQELAYGERATGETIKPFSTLIFEVELLSIEK